MELNCESRKSDSGIIGLYKDQMCSTDSIAAMVFLSFSVSCHLYLTHNFSIKNKQEPSIKKNGGMSRVK